MRKTILLVQFFFVTSSAAHAMVPHIPSIHCSKLTAPQAPWSFTQFDQEFRHQTYRLSTWDEYNQVISELLTAYLATQPSPAEFTKIALDLIRWKTRYKGGRHN